VPTCVYVMTVYAAVKKCDAVLACDWFLEVLQLPIKTKQHRVFLGGADCYDVQGW